MTSKLVEWLRQPVLSERPLSADRRGRTILFVVWLIVTLGLATVHIPWRDEARAWNLMRMGDGWIDMFRVVQGEGHPYLWYVLLKAGDTLFGSPQVLLGTALLIGISAVALLVFRGPFRLGLLVLLAFSLHLGFEYTVVARNYGISALIMLVIAALWQRIRDTAWLGLLLLLLANTCVPAVFIAGALFLYRLLELWADDRNLRSPQWRRLLLNALLLGAGTLLCFVAVYPPANDAAASTSSAPLTFENVVIALFTSVRAFTAIGFGSGSELGHLVVVASMLMFVDRPRALIAAVAAFITLKLFFFFVYGGSYRHSALFFILLIVLAWIEADKGWLKDWKASRQKLALGVGSTAFLLLMVMQTARYVREPIENLVMGRPFSHAAEVADILERPEYRGSMLMIDPDTMGESVAFQTGRPNWLIRQDRPGTVTPLALSGNKRLTLDRLLVQAGEVQARTGKPVVIALALPLDRIDSGSYDMMYDDLTLLDPASVARFKAATRRIASLRSSGSGEEYDVYVYPR